MKGVISMAKFTAFSNRIYKHTLHPTYVDGITETLLVFNSMEHSAYKLKYDAKYNAREYEKSVYMIIKSHYGVTSDYYINSAVRLADGLLSSQAELHKLYISQSQENIKSRKDKIKSLEKELKQKLNIKQSLVKISKAKKENARRTKEHEELLAAKPNSKKKLKLVKVPKPKTYVKGNEYLIDGDNLIFGVRRYGKENLRFESAYLFEVQYLNGEIARLKNLINQVKYGLQRAEHKLQMLQENPPKQVCFGGSKLFKKQFTTYSSHEAWKNDFQNARNKSFTISGRKDALHGNFVFRYHGNTLTFSSILGEEIQINNLVFPYGQDIVREALDRKSEDRKPVAWTVEDHGAYYIFKCTVELPENKNKNHSKAEGVISYDINYDHLAWCNINKYGSLIGHGRIYFYLEGKTRNQATNIIETAAIELCDIAKHFKKPLCGEALDTEKSKSKLLYGSKNRNRKLSQFAYKKTMSAILSRANKVNIEVYNVDPEYTSQIGKIKYMKNLGLSIHDAAALAIGRRGMGFKEKIPKMYYKFVPNSFNLTDEKIKESREKLKASKPDVTDKELKESDKKLEKQHENLKWRYLTNYFKGTRVNDFYKTVLTRKTHSLKDIKGYLIGGTDEDVA
jgi:IS605 OrfB family transposase